MAITFWGVRGSIPTPGQGTVRYGGNTSCVEVRCGRDHIILDAGTGLRRLGQALLAESPRGPLNLTLLISHTHWDHIHGLPFFAPVFQSRCRLRILGCRGARKNLVAALTGQMNSPYFPVPFSKLPAQIKIEEIPEAGLAIGSVQVRARRVNHPGLCVGYRLFSPAGSICFFPDAEPRHAGADREMVDLVRDADVLILDSQYDRAEYRRRRGWGHGCVDHSVKLALQAGVKKLVLFHHDPDHDDQTIDALAAHARRLVARQKGKLKVEAAREGRTLRLSGTGGL
jgi:phosphoribosyl 1,2-cyclic phosphodiesterase